VYRVLEATVAYAMLICTFYYYYYYLTYQFQLTTAAVFGGKRSELFCAVSCYISITFYHHKPAGGRQ